MSQAAFIDIGDFDEKDVNLDEPPRSITDYLRQVVVSRRRLPEVVTAKMPIDEPSKQLYASTSDPLDDNWCKLKFDEYMENRARIESLRSYCKKLQKKFPVLDDYEGWCKFCMEIRDDSIPLNVKDVNLFKDHKGNPPTLSLVLTLNFLQIRSILKHLFHFFLENGYSRALYQWIYALLLVVDESFNWDDVGLLEKVLIVMNNLRKNNKNSDNLTRNELAFIPVIIIISKSAYTKYIANEGISQSILAKYLFAFYRI
ncbi:unnamed protein product [Dracunculus medinensis]|uniref:Gem-associated protein 2 n=1 Tax=Dracunculus medinensis TaxID=318479 RepID=A0A0N4UPP8_DRAME|nr:unnamed protein product [Dracunculus medinensis]